MSEGKKKCFTCAGGEMHLSVEEQWECDGCGEIEIGHSHDQLVEAAKDARGQVVYLRGLLSKKWLLETAHTTDRCLDKSKAALKAAGEGVS